MVFTALETPCRPCGRPFIPSPVPRSLPRPCTRVNTFTSRIKAYELNERGARTAVRGMQVHAADSGASAVATQDTAPRVTDDVEVVLQATASAPGGCELRIQSQLRGEAGGPVRMCLPGTHAEGVQVCPQDFAPLVSPRCWVPHARPSSPIHRLRGESHGGLPDGRSPL